MAAPTSPVEPKSLVAYPTDANNPAGNADHDGNVYREVSHGGLEVVHEPDPGLQVAEPRFDLSHRRTWEKTSELPEAMNTVPAAQPNVYAYHPHSPGSPPPPQTAFSNLSPDVDYRATSTGGPPQDPAATRRDRFCGLRRHIFLVVLAIGAFAIIAAVGIGVGLGLGLRKNTSTPSAATTTTSTPTSTMTLPYATATQTTGPEVNITCPADNLTIYDVPGSITSDGYLMLCGRDYSSQDGATDIFSRNASDFLTCLETCSITPNCIAASWGPVDNVETCWCKSHLGEVNWSEGWFFAVLDNATTNLLGNPNSNSSEEDGG